MLPVGGTPGVVPGTAHDCHGKAAGSLPEGRTGVNGFFVTGDGQKMDAAPGKGGAGAKDIKIVVFCVLDVLCLLAWSLYSPASACSTCSSWPSTLTFFQTLRTLPSPSISQVERWMPIETLPYMFFSRQAP